VLRIAFSRNIAKLANNNKGIISDHQYGRAHATGTTPLLNKLLTVQLLIQKRTEDIVLDNDAKGCYDRIISGVALASLRRLGYSKESVKMLGLICAKLLPLPQPPLRSRTDARTNPSAQRATQLRSVLARVYAVSRQNQITTTVP
jgi:hypothetical protein